MKTKLKEFTIFADFHRHHKIPKGRGWYDRSSGSNCDIFHVYHEKIKGLNYCASTHYTSLSTKMWYKAATWYDYSPCFTHEKFLRSDKDFTPMDLFAMLKGVHDMFRYLKLNTGATQDQLQECKECSVAREAIYPDPYGGGWEEHELIRTLEKVEGKSPVELSPTLCSRAIFQHNQFMETNEISIKRDKNQ